MKKVLAVLLAVMMLFSVIAIGVAAETNTNTTAANGEGGDNVQLPEWLTSLIARLKQVIAKLLLKLGIKLNWDKIFA